MIYLDNNATTFLDPTVSKQIISLMERNLGNPASTHRLGQEAKEILFQSRRAIASFFQVKESELLFTSSATEALSTLIRGMPRESEIITSNLEHLAVLEPLKERGSKVTYLAPKLGYGSITLDQIEQAVTSRTELIILMGANNETGIITDFEQIADFAEKRGIFFIMDAVALLGKEPVPFPLPQGVTAAVFSGHKIHAPVGIGLAIVRKKFPFMPLIFGGGQQEGKRGGTEHVIGVAALAAALKALEPISSITTSIRQLRDRFEDALLASLQPIVIHGKNERRVSNTSSIAFLGVDGETLLMQLDLAGVATSHGSACSSGGISSSRVLQNMGISPKEAQSTLRFSLSRFTTKEEIDKAIHIIIDIVSRLRKIT